MKSVNLAKVTGRDEERRSRLHTRRGDFAVRGLVRALAHRYTPADEPWMAPSAVERLDQLLTTDSTLLEFGSGASTAWFAARCRKVTSIEPNADWFAYTRDALSGLHNVELIQMSATEALKELTAIDVVIVDHTDEPGATRVDVVRAVREVAQIIILDDSDRAQYADAEQILFDWTAERFVGFRSRPLVPTETTIWLR